MARAFILWGVKRNSPSRLLSIFNSFSAHAQENPNSNLTDYAALIRYLTAMLMGLFSVAVGTTRLASKE